MCVVLHIRIMIYHNVFNAFNFFFKTRFDTYYLIVTWSSFIP